MTTFSRTQLLGLGLSPRQAEMVLASQGGAAAPVAADAIVLSSTGAPPTEFRMFAAGANPTSKGTFLFTPRSALLVMTKYREAGIDLCFDYGHSMLRGAPTFESQKAAGWWRPEIRQSAAGPELWAAGVRWTEQAAKALMSREFRYYSPAFLTDEKTNEVVEIINCALTNTPATRNQQPLAASSVAPGTMPVVAPATLSADEKRLCWLMRIRPSDYLETKRRG